MRKFILTILILLGFIGCANAATIPNIVDGNFPSVEYPVRDNAFIILLQPVPDNSGDYTMTICNKQSSCRQTSMLESELRYIGLFIEDMKSVLSLDLSQKLTKEQWLERQTLFRDMYADYMNKYDGLFGSLQRVTPPKFKVNVSGIKGFK